MTQDSWPWNCSPTNGDYGAITVNDLVNAQQFGANTQPNSDGVVYWTSTSPLPGGAVAVDGLLEPSLAGSVVTIATGVGMVQGWNYINTADVDFDFAADAGNANATDLIVLQRGDPTSALTVRLARLKGAASSTATVTQSEALWEVAIAEVTLNGSGLPTAVNDVRRFTNQVMSWRQGGSATDWDVFGSVNYLVGNVEIQSGVAEGAISSGNIDGGGSITFPRQFSSEPIVLVVATTDAPVAFSNPVVVRDIVVAKSSATCFIRTSDSVAVPSNRTYSLRWIAIGTR